MSQQELLRRVVHALDRAGVEYMVTGSTASSLQGEPRATHDIDLVVAMTADAVAVLVDEFPAPAYFLDPQAARTAIESRGMFNLISIDEGDKVDFWLLTDEAFDQSRFARRRVEHIFGIELRVPSPEDTILAKLHWIRAAGGGEKHFADARSVYELHAGDLDLQYLGRWSEQLAVTDLWDRVQREAEPI